MSYTSNLVPTTPKYSSFSNSSGTLGSPASQALNNVQNNTPTWQQNLSSVMSNIPKPTGNITEQTITNPDGSSIKHKFDVGQTKISDKPSISNGGLINTNNNSNSNSSSTPGQLTGTDLANALKAINPGGTVASQQAILGNNTGLINTNPPPPVPTVASTAAGSVGTAAGSVAAGNNGNAITQPYTDEINQLYKKANGMETGYETSGLTGNIGTGLAGTAAGNIGSLITGLTNQENTQLTGNAQALTGENQANTAYGTAGGLVSPSVAGYGQTVFNPATGQYTGGSSGVSPSDPFYATMQQYAQMAANGQLGQVPSSITGNAVLNAQLNQMATAINPSYNPVSSSAQSSIITQQTGQTANYKSALQQGQNLASQAKDLIDTFGLNPSELNAANGAIQKIALNTSDPHYKMLNNYLADISSRYAQILTPAGGSNTDTTRAVASGMLDSLANGTSLETVLDGLDQQAQAVISGVPTSYGNSSSTSSSGNTWNDIFEK